MFGIMLIAGAMAAARLPEPMLDARCDEYGPVAGASDLGDGVALYQRQTADHVWLCFKVPEGSYATLDLRIAAPKLSEPLNLHASAQLGGWPADRAEAAPTNAASPQWWKGVDGWWATTTHYNGQFMTVRGREVQLSKNHFGRGTWSLAATLSDVATGSSGEFATIRWPRSGTIEIRAD